MELKDILPFLDPETLKRWTEYQNKLDWSMMEEGKRYTIETLADFIRSKGFGGDVRESIAQAIEWINDLTDKQILNEKQTQILTDSLKAKYKELEDRYDAQIGALTEDSEVIDARGGKATLGQRLDDTDAQWAENLNKQFIFKSENGFGILEQSLENKVSEHISAHGYSWFVDRLITDFENKLIDDLRINGKSLYRATDGSLSNKWSDGCTIEHIDTNGLSVNVLNGTHVTKTINYNTSSKLKGIEGISDQYLKDKIVRRIGSVNVNEKTYTQNDVLFQDTFNVILRVESDIDLLNPKYMVQGIKDRGTATSGEGVFFSKTHNCLAISLSTSGKLYGISEPTLVDRANVYFQSNVIAVIYNKAVPSVEVNNQSFPSFYFSGNLNIVPSVKESTNVSGKTYTSDDILYQNDYVIDLKINSNIDINNPKFKVEGFKTRVNPNDEGVYYSANSKTLVIRLQNSPVGASLYGRSEPTLLERANAYLSENAVKVTYGVSSPEYYWNDNTVLIPIAEAKVACDRSEIKDFILNENGVKYNGQLKTINAQLTNSKGKPIQLKGIGTHHLLQYKDLQTFEAIRTLKYYGVEILRLSAYVTDRDYLKTSPSLGVGYVNSVSETRARMDELIEYCKQLDMYCIVDWHTFADELILDYVTEAKAFFNYFAQKYPNDPYLLWEFTNEPFYETSDDMASFIAQVAPEVIATNPNAIMLTGVNEDSLVVLYNKIQTAISLPNLYLSKHWYIGMYLKRGYDAGKANLDVIIDGIVSAKLPFFVTEWGNSMPSGDGERFDKLSEYFVQKLKNNNISWCTWKLTNQDMTTSLLKFSDDREYLKYGGWIGSVFSDYGKITLTYFND